MALVFKSTSQPGSGLQESLSGGIMNASLVSVTLLQQKGSIVKPVLGSFKHAIPTPTLQYHVPNGSQEGNSRSLTRYPYSH